MATTARLEVFVVVSCRDRDFENFDFENSWPLADLCQQSTSDEQGRIKLIDYTRRAIVLFDPPYTHIFTLGNKVT